MLLKAFDPKRLASVIAEYRSCAVSGRLVHSVTANYAQALNLNVIILKKSAFHQHRVKVTLW